MIVIKRLLWVFLIASLISCNQKEELRIEVNRIENNVIYFSIQNNTNDTIRLLKPEHNFLCYDDEIIRYKKSDYKEIYQLAFMDTEGISTFGFTGSSSGKQTYKKIIIKGKETYSDSMMIPDKNTADCVLFPRIDNTTVLSLVKDSVIYKSDFIMKKVKP